MTSQLALTEHEGTIAVPASTLTGIVGRAAELVDGVRVRRPRRSVEVDVSGPSVTVSVRLVVRYGVVLPELAAAVQREVATALERMCELEVRQVDVSVEEVVER